MKRSLTAAALLAVLFTGAAPAVAAQSSGPGTQPVVAAAASDGSTLDTPLDVTVTPTDTSWGGSCETPLCKPLDRTKCPSSSAPLSLNFLMTSSSRISKLRTFANCRGAFTIDSCHVRAI